jgi:fatty-acyl-CoA synthase
MIANLAVIQEILAREIPERTALIWRERALTYAELNARSRRLAHAFRAWGLGCHTERPALQPWESGQDHIALYLYNCNEYLEGMYGAFQSRAVAFNVNYRYVAEELRYVLANARARAILFHSAFAPTLAAVRPQLPHLECLVQVPDESGHPLLDGAVWYDDLLAAQPADALDLPYTADDLYILYTGGTTGMPKGVLWRQEDVFFNGLGGHIPGFNRLDSEDKLREHIQLGLGGRFVIAFPFMHGAGHWAAFNTFHRGGTVILPDENRKLDAHGVWQAVERHRVDQIGLIGDAVALPLLAALRAHRYDTSSITVCMSTAAVLSGSVKAELLSYLNPGVMFIESIGGSESGMQAMSYGTSAGPSGLPSYNLREGTVVLTADRRGILAPGAAAEEIGWIASTGHLPLGYLGDEAKTRETFPLIDGVRYVVGGDRAFYDADGKLVFLGRESMCINTGGEKVYAEEVERVVKSHPAVYDSLVVGVPSARWGQQVTAVVSLRPGHVAPDVKTLRTHCASHLADYKIPKAIVTAGEIVRLPSGKPDYGWARAYASANLKTE